MANRETNIGYHSRIPQNLEERIETLESGSGSGGYDIVVDCGEDFLTDYTVAWDYEAVKAKVLAGKPVTGIAYIHFNYDDAVDGGTNINVLPLNYIEIYSTEGEISFTNIVANIATPTSLTVFVRSFRLKFDSETGAIRNMTGLLNRPVELS